MSLLSDAVSMAVPSYGSRDPSEPEANAQRSVSLEFELSYVFQLHKRWLKFDHYFSDKSARLSLPKRYS
jgi:hypothetical protein